MKTTHTKKQTVITLFVKKTFVVSLLLILSTVYTDLSAQQLSLLDNKIGSLKAIENQTRSREGSRLESLAYELNSMVYLRDGQLLSYGETNPVYMEINYEDFNVLYASNTLYNNIEYIRIKVTPNRITRSILDVNRLTHFPSLKYIQFECNFNYSPNDISKLYVPSQGINMLYQIVIAE